MNALYHDWQAEMLRRAEEAQQQALEAQEEPYLINWPLAFGLVMGLSFWGWFAWKVIPMVWRAL